jgi:hypothetical protein
MAQYMHIALHAHVYMYIIKTTYRSCKNKLKGNNLIVILIYVSNGKGLTTTLQHISTVILTHYNEKGIFYSKKSQHPPLQYMVLVTYAPGYAPGRIADLIIHYLNILNLKENLHWRKISYKFIYKHEISKCTKYTYNIFI